MADTFGATFAPFSDPSGQNASTVPVQQAIQLLGMRVPRSVGAAAPAPAALLTSPGSSGRPDVHSAVLQTILKTIMGQGMPQADTPPPTSLTAAAPPSPGGGVPSPFSAPPRDTGVTVPTSNVPTPGFAFEQSNDPAPPTSIPPPDAGPKMADTPRIDTPAPSMPMLSIDDLKKTAGFRQYDPGLFTNDESFAKGVGYVPDAGPSGYKQVRLG